MEENYYTVGQVAQFTGLSERTIRSHIAAGFLTGEKMDGAWRFTAEQLEAFFSHPAVKPGIQAKKNSIVYDFLLGNTGTDHEVCLILDLPGTAQGEVSAFFCEAICHGNFHNLRFSFDTLGGKPRVILKGRAEEVLPLANRYYGR